MENIDELMEHLQAIKEYCSKTICENCPMHDGYNCNVTRIPPEKWELEKRVIISFY